MGSRGRQLVEIAGLPRREVASMGTPRMLPLGPPPNGWETKKIIKQTYSAGKPQQARILESNTQEGLVGTGLHVLAPHAAVLSSEGSRGRENGKQFPPPPNLETRLTQSTAPNLQGLFSVLTDVTHPQPWPFPWSVVTPNDIFHFLK